MLLPWTGKKLIIVVKVVLFSLSVFFFSPAKTLLGQPYPLEVVDALGRKVLIPHKPQRIVSIFSSNTEILYSVGAGSRIVGVEEKTHFPPEVTKLPKIGGRLGFSVEKIASLNPDLVVLTPARHAAATLVKPLEIIGVPVVVILHKDVPSIFKNILFIGRIVGEETRARCIVKNMKKRVEAIREKIASLPPRTVYLETGVGSQGRFRTVNSGTYSYDILRLAGGKSIFPDLKRGFQVSGEAILLADPDWILVAGNQNRMDEIKSRPGWCKMKAVRNHKIRMVKREFLLIPGPRIVFGIEQIAHILFPEVFHEKDK